MKIALVTDAWEPQVNGVVRTLPCPTYPDIRLSLLSGSKVTRRLTDFDPDAIHIATEGPLGLAARRFVMARDLPFTTAYHTRFPEYVRARIGMPLSWTYAFLRWFHGPSRAVMVPTDIVKKDLEANGFRNVVLWSRGVDRDIFKPIKSNRLNTEPPIFLYVGRVAVEKNIEAFLALDLPGSKWVAGAGPSLNGIRGRYPSVNFLGVLDPQELAQVYAAADVFVFPSKTDTFGLVLLEAMACSLPVAAYPVTGPLDVLGDSRAGVMHEDLRTACLAALELKREDAAAHARKFSWRASTEQFLASLYPYDRMVAAPA